MSSRLLQLVNSTAEQHCLTFAGIALDLEQSAVLVFAPFSEISVIEDPAVQVLQ